MTTPHSSTTVLRAALGFSVWARGMDVSSLGPRDRSNVGRYDFLASIRCASFSIGKHNVKGGTRMLEVKVCTDNELVDGAVRIVRVKDVEIAVIRHAGQYFAYHNHCPHQGGPACEGVRMPQVVERLDADGRFIGHDYDENDIHIVCPWHGYEFHLSDGVNVSDKRLRLKKFKVVERDGGVYVAL
jgi:nitrite reductase/ring-hydroxylating ferredoxin subunit